MWHANKNKANFDAIGERQIMNEDEYLENKNKVVGTDRYGHSLSKKSYPDLQANNFPYKGQKFEYRKLSRGNATSNTTGTGKTSISNSKVNTFENQAYYNIKPKS